MGGMKSDELFLCIMGIALAAFVIPSAVLFIVECVKAKREHRRKKLGFMVAFIIAMHVTLTCAAAYAFLWLMGYAIMKSM
ncbi:MAG: hypothetical protein J6X33_04740 [Clostridiales bacterium]|nr:hypothetical protein [Clostridiales bacterium]